MTDEEIYNSLIEKKLAESSSENESKQRDLISHYRGCLQDSKTSLTTVRTVKRVIRTAITVVFALWSFNSLETVGKLLVSPKIFLLKEGASLLHKPTCDACGQK